MSLQKLLTLSVLSHCFELGTGWAGGWSIIVRLLLTFPPAGHCFRKSTGLFGILSIVLEKGGAEVLREWTMLAVGVVRHRLGGYAVVGASASLEDVVETVK